MARQQFQHYISQFLLKKFCCAEQPALVWRRDLRHNTARKVAIRSVSGVKNTWGEDVERHISAVESRAARAVAELLRFCKAAGQESLPIGDYTAEKLQQRMYLLALAPYFAALIAINKMGRDIFHRQDNIKAMLHGRQVKEYALDGTVASAPPSFGIWRALTRAEKADLQREKKQNPELYRYKVYFKFEKMLLRCAKTPALLPIKDGRRNISAGIYGGSESLLREFAAPSSAHALYFSYPELGLVELF